MATNPYGALAQPQLGYGDQDPTKIDQVNQWMRAQPWYASFLASIGQSPSKVKLNDQQKAQLVKLAQANGVVVDEGHNGQEIDDSGNFKPAGNSVWKDIAIGAGIGGLALTGIGLAGVGPLAGLAGAGDTALAASEAGAGASEAGGVGAGLAGAAEGATGAAGAAGAGTGAALASDAFIGPTAAELGGVPGSVLAGTAGAVAPPIASSTPSWLGSAITGGIGAAGQLIGAGIQSGAITDAAKIQAQTAAEALAYEKQRDAYLQSTEANRYGTMVTERAPYVATGNSANSAMASYLGLPAPPPQAPVTPPPTYQAPPPPGLAASTATPGTAVPRQGPGMVTMRAPDGTTQQVPTSQQAHYQSLGATVVG